MPQAPAINRTLARFAAQPALFAACAVILHILLALPILATHHFDPSVFVVAGDKFVAAGQTPARLIVRPHSDGYDGQFYYRLALAPFLTEPTAFGITLDHPAWRMQRIFLPLLAHAISFGNAAGLAWVFTAINLAGIFAIAWLAASLARRRAWPWYIPAAIAAWPAWLIALTHDTTEILAAALLLGALSAYAARRFFIYAPLMALATLTRETAILAALGIALAEAWRLLPPRGDQSIRRFLLAASATLPFMIWRHIVTALWNTAPQSHGVALNAGWPLLGWTETILANALNHAVGAAAHPRTLLMRLTVLASIAVLFPLTAAALRALPAALRHSRGIAASWLLILALMTLLTANGPLVEPTAYFRALAEFWVTLWLVLGFAGCAAPVPRTLAVVGFALVLRNWQLCWIQLR